MLNSEKYRTVEERAKAFRGFCHEHEKCGDCVFYDNEKGALNCILRWLELEAEKDNIEDCPFCRAKCRLDSIAMKVVCINCGYESEVCFNPLGLIAKHNRFAHAAMEAEKKEEK